MAQSQTDLQPHRRLDGTSGRRGLFGRRRRRQLNPRQRQGMLLLVVAAAGLIGVFALIAGYVSNVAKQVGPKIGVLELNTTLQPYQPVSPSMLTYASVPEKWAPQNALHSLNDAVGLVSQVPLQPGVYLQRGMLTSPPALQPGEEEMAIYVDAETGVAGQISPGSQVSIVAAYQGHLPGPGSPGGTTNSARIVVPLARVLAIGTPTTTGGSATGSSQPTTQSQVVPVTFALTPAEVLAVSYAESFAQKVRLALIAPGSGAPVAVAPYKPGL
ncbi:MAG: Flp pilus assembly protein CpaB [Solirubrobacterales bacterium]|nr:Flp pilus assembly protein CpaB [Solirubrobacterales bacterium]